MKSSTYFIEHTALLSIRLFAFWLKKLSILNVLYILGVDQSIKVMPYQSRGISNHKVHIFFHSVLSL